MRVLIRLACGCCVLLLTACSTTRLAYDHLDILLRWEISDYVDLTAQQRKSLDADLYPLWSWHRRTQLPLYAADLRQLADAVQSGPLSVEQIEIFSAHVAQHWQDLVMETLPGYIRLNAGLNDAQIEGVIQKMSKDIDEAERRREKRSLQDRQKHLVNDMNQQLSDWIGRLNTRQRQLVAQWGAEALPETSAWATEQHAVLDRYAVLLASSSQIGFEDRMRNFLLTQDNSDKSQSVDAVEKKRWIQLMADISATLEPAQRKHLRERLLGYAEEFEMLAAEASSQFAHAAAD